MRGPLNRGPLKFPMRNGQAFITKAGDEDVALLLMDTQGAWDARMTKDPSRILDMGN